MDASYGGTTRHFCFRRPSIEEPRDLPNLDYCQPVSVRSGSRNNFPGGLGVQLINEETQRIESKETGL